MTDVLVAKRIEDPLSDVEAIIKDGYFQIRPSRPYVAGGQWVDDAWSAPIPMTGSVLTFKLDPLADVPYELFWHYTDGRNQVKEGSEFRTVTASGTPLKWEDLTQSAGPGAGPALPSSAEARLLALETLYSTLTGGASTTDGITDMSPAARTFNQQSSYANMRSTLGVPAVGDAPAAHTHAVPGGLVATGTPSATTFLSGAGTWAVPTGTSGTAITGAPGTWPSTFPPSAHTHATSDVTGLDSALSTLTSNLANVTASPILTGTPTAPTPASGDNDTSVATTAFVQTELLDKADLNHSHLEAQLPVDLGAWYIDRTDANPQPARPVLQFGRRVIAIGSSAPWDNALQGDVIQEQRFYVPTPVFTDAAIEGLATGTTITAGAPGNAGWTNTQISGGGANTARDSTVGTLPPRGARFARLVQTNTTSAYLGFASLGSIPVASFEVYFRYVGSMPAVNSTLFTAFDDASFTSTHRNLMVQVNTAGSLTVLSGVGAALGLEMTCPTALGANTWYRLNLNASAADNFLWAMLDTGPDTVPIWSRSKTPGSGHAITSFDGFNVGFGNASGATTVDVRARAAATRGVFGATG